MKFHLIITILGISIFGQQCSKTTTASVPLCIEQKITDIKKQAKWNPPATVNEYMYNGKTVYLFSSDCCDQYNMVYDSQCNYVCAPSGGITGKGDSKCPDFNAAAKLVRLVWKDER